MIMNFSQTGKDNFSRQYLSDFRYTEIQSGTVLIMRQHFPLIFKLEHTRGARKIAFDNVLMTKLDM